MNGLKFIPEVPKWFSSKRIKLYETLTKLYPRELNENTLRDEQTIVTHISITHARNMSKAGVHISLR
jgi:hypothetical protein